MVLAVALLAITQLPTTARAQVDSREAIALQNQLYQLRQEVQVLRDQVARGGGGAVSGGRSSSSGNDMIAQLLTRVDSLEEQVRQLRGRVDETQYQVQRQNAELGKRIDDLAFQMGNAPSAGPAPRPAASGGPAPVPLAVPTPSGAPPAGPASTAPRVRTPEIALQEGNAALARRDYATAEQAAREVLANRASPRAYDGQMLLAQALSGQRQYPQAAIAYDDAYNRSRKGAYAQDALLGLANSLAAINEKKAACDTLGRLRTEFPQPRNDLRDAITASGQRAGCR
jgi:TolA-binding protein